MSTTLLVGGVVLALGLAVVRALLIDEIRGRIHRRASASVEATIGEMPDELQEEWGPEWRAELGALSSMPVSAIAFARGLRATAGELTEAALVPAGRVGVPARRKRFASWPFGDRRARRWRDLSVFELTRRLIQLVFGIVVALIPPALALFARGSGWPFVFVGVMLTVAFVGLVGFVYFSGSRRNP
jgi:hypothetical protein